MPDERSLHVLEDPGVAAWAALLRTHATVVRILEREVEDQTGLPLSWYDVLLELTNAGGDGLRMQELAGRVVLSRTRVSRLVDDLVTAGLVTRHPDPVDGRAVRATVTPAGRERLRAAAPTYLEGIARHFSRHVPEAELRVLHDALHRVLAAAEEN